FEKSVLTFIQKSERLRSAKEMRKAFIELKKEFENLSQNPSDNVMLRYFNFIAWLDSKIENKTFAEAVKSHYLKNLPKD
ncbi:hypothetical protein OAU00_03110, partial [Saprospiraceae bacterium]|nr:hypothetical protein [Saprospiraceae bacterium]